MNKFLLCLLAALVFTPCAAKSDPIADQVKRQITYANKAVRGGMCYAPITFDHVPSVKEVNTVRTIAERYKWKVTDSTKTQVTIVRQRPDCLVTPREPVLSTPRSEAPLPY